MNPTLRIGVFFGMVVAAILAPFGSAADKALGGDDWKYDIVYRRKGTPYRGLVLKRGGGELDMWCIVRNPGRPAIYYRVWLSENEIADVKLLPPSERQTLRRRLAVLRDEHKRLSERMSGSDANREPTGNVKVELRPTIWNGDKNAKALRYDSSHFTLLSNAPSSIVTVTALRLEKVYAAYVRCLPPRAEGKATTILLPQSLADYRTLVRGQGRHLLNPAFFDPKKNQIVCAFDWQHLTEEVRKLHVYHEKLKNEMKRREAELSKAYKGAIPLEFRSLFADKRRAVAAAEAHNKGTFKRSQRRLMQRLYHEAFHAYLLNFVYPPRDGELPRWLNEGLAQIFETAVFEVGELRIGHADKERLDAVRLALSKDALLPLVDVLRSDGKQFQVAHDGDKQVSDRYYLASWALAFYLTFERKILGTPALDAYVRDGKRGVDPLEAFHTLTGQTPARFERDFQEYLKHLRPDGRIGGGS